MARLLGPLKPKESQGSADGIKKKHVVRLSLGKIGQCIQSNGPTHGWMHATQINDQFIVDKDPHVVVAVELKDFTASYKNRIWHSIVK